MADRKDYFITKKGDGEWIAPNGKTEKSANDQKKATKTAKTTKTEKKSK